MTQKILLDVDNIRTVILTGKSLKVYYKNIPSSGADVFHMDTEAIAQYFYDTLKRRVKNAVVIEGQVNVERS